MPQLTSLSYAYPEVTAARRSELSPRGEATALISVPVFSLTTCLRVELAWFGGAELAQEVVDHLYGDSAPLSEGVMRTDQDAFLHLCRVAAGLESPLKGEAEVFAQFRRAARPFVTDPAPAGDLAHVLQAVIGVSRATRRSLGHVVEGSLAVEAARSVESNEHVAILGGGAMARMVARYLKSADFAVYTRRATVIEGRPTRPWEEVPEALATSPAIVATIPGGSTPFGDAAHLQALDKRHEPLLLVDLGMPPAFSPPSSSLIRYVGVDELASVVEAPLVTEAEAAVEQEAIAAWRRLAAPEQAGSIIAGIIDRAEKAADEEVRRVVNRLPDSPQYETVLRQLAHTVARRILHPPVSYVGSSDLSPAELDLFVEAFGLGDE